MADDSTLAVHAGDEPDPVTGALDQPIVQSSAFAFQDAADAASRIEGSTHRGVYTRWHNPSVEAFERKVAALEGAEAAVALASGMAAINAVVGALVGVNDHVVAPYAVYSETRRALERRWARLGVRTTFVNATDPAVVVAALEERTRLVLLETPANPTLAITDVAAVAERARAAGAIVAVDSTFATPFHQKPLALGADLVLHSATKAIGGHGDAVGGVVCGATERCAHVRDDAVRSGGAVMAPMTAWLLSRGLRTLPLRAERASSNALELARRLAEHPRVERVHYPGLPSHPGHEVATRQMRGGFGAIVAFEVRGGTDGGRAVYDRVELVTRAVSLGDVKTLLTHPASTTHAPIGADARRAAGISDGLMRLSVGIESVEDLWGDLERALGAG